MNGPWTSGRARRTRRGVTVLEVLVAIFVMLIGVTGVISLFPVGVRLSQMSADDVAGAMTVQNALAAVRLQAGLRERVRAYDLVNNPNGDVLAWNTTPDPAVSEGIGGITGTVTNVGPPLPTVTELQPSCSNVDDRTLDVKDADKNDCALLLMTSGEASWKLYRLDSGSSIASSKFVSTENGYTDFPKDELKTGDAFRLIGARSTGHVWATVPEQFFGDGTGDPSSYQLGAGAVPGYGYLAVLTRVKDRAETFRVDILVYKNYDASQPPEGNAPAVACYTTILSGDMLK